MVGLLLMQEGYWTLVVVACGVLIIDVACEYAPPPGPCCLAPEYRFCICTGDGGGGEACIGVVTISTLGNGDKP